MNVILIPTRNIAYAVLSYAIMYTIMYIYTTW